MKYILIRYSNQLMGKVMKLFTDEIDLKLENLANTLNAKISKDRPVYPEALRTFEERRIDWTEHKVNKAIIIQPNFEKDGVNAEIWNFGIAVWYFDDEIDLRFYDCLAKEKSFEFIVNQLDEFLVVAVERLFRINMKELENLSNHKYR